MLHTLSLGAPMDPVQSIAIVLERVVRLSKLRIGLGPIGSINVSLETPFAKQSVDARLQKIEIARKNLTEALSAVDELKETAEENKRDLTLLTTAIKNAENDKKGLQAQLGDLKKLANIDTNSVRAALRIPTEVDKWKERIWGFIIGVVAAIIVTLGWELGLKPYMEVHSPQKLHPAPIEQPAKKEPPH